MISASSDAPVFSSSAPRAAAGSADGSSSAASVGASGVGSSAGSELSAGGAAALSGSSLASGSDFFGAGGAAVSRSGLASPSITPKPITRNARPDMNSRRARPPPRSEALRWRRRSTSSSSSGRTGRTARRPRDDPRIGRKVVRIRPRRLLRDSAPGTIRADRAARSPRARAPEARYLDRWIARRRSWPRPGSSEATLRAPPRSAPPSAATRELAGLVVYLLVERLATCSCSARMRGCVGSSVVDRSAICAFSAPSRSRSRWISCEFSTSSDASGAPPFSRTRFRPGRPAPAASARAARARASSRIDLAKLLGRQVAGPRCPARPDPG